MDTWSRVDLPPVAQLRRTEDRKVVMELEKGDASALAGRGLPLSRGVRGQGPRRQDRYLGHHHPAHEFRSRQEVSGDRADLRRAAGLLRPQDVQRGSARPGAGRAGIHRGADRRHGHQQPLQGLPRCGLEEPGRRRLPGPHPVAQGRGREIPVLRHHPRGHFRHLGGRAEFAGRRAVPSRVLQGGGDQQRLPR